MRVIWIGDQRSEQMKFWYELDEAQKTEETEEETPNLEFEYILNTEADSSWFNSYAAKKAIEFIENDSIVIVSLGINDCINSSIWSALDINKAAEDCAEGLNYLINSGSCSAENIYFCTVTKVNANIPRAENLSGFADKTVINSRVKTFNDMVKSKSTAAFIDCYQYFEDTSFATRDGLLYTPETSLYLVKYIMNNIRTTPTTSFIKRLDDNPPTLTGKGEDDQFWTLTSAGGLNEVNGGSNNINMPYAGCALPNCTSYAWGRFYEITGERPKLLKRNAERWFGYDDKEDRAYTCSTNGKVTDADYKKMAEHGEKGDGYKRGKDPKPGAVICWEGKDGEAGHVAIVEEVFDDGSIITSESGWQNKKVWWTTKRTNSNGNWGYGSSYIFQGFIYCPAVTASGPYVSVSHDDVVVKSGGLTQSEMEINALYIWNYLGSLPDDQKWTLQAVAGILGNMEKESSINPGRHESSGSGFGLVQWTPKSKYTDWLAGVHPTMSENDIDGQLERIIWEKDTGHQYSKDDYKYTFKEFAKSTDSAYTLACAFAFDYERSAVTLWGFHTNSWDRKSVYCRKSGYDSKCETNCVACLPCYKAKFGQARTDQQVEKNKQDLRDARGGAAEKWFKYLLPYAPGACFAEKFVVDNLKLDEKTTTALGCSFIVSHAKSGVAKLKNSSDKVLAKKTLSVAVPEDVPEEDRPTVSIVSFKFSDLTPNTTYKIVIEVDSDLGEETVTQTLEVKTKQSYPKANTISITPDKADKATINDSFTAKWSSLSSSDWGYWNSKKHGFQLEFYVNGKVVKTVNVGSGTTTYKFKPIEIAPKIKLDDSFQIGINPWVTENKDKIVFAKQFPNASNCLKFLHQPIKTYLNIN